MPRPRDQDAGGEEVFADGAHVIVHAAHLVQGGEGAGADDEASGLNVAGGRDALFLGRTGQQPSLLGRGLHFLQFEGGDAEQGQDAEHVG